MRAGATRALEVRGALSSSLKNERRGNIVVIILAMMLDAMLPVSAKMVEANTVGVWIHDLKEFPSEFDKLSWINEAFEDGCLNPLAIVEAGFGNPSKSGFSGGTGRRNIVGDENIHQVFPVYLVRKAG
jgi:hypothetical protein